MIKKVYTRERKHLPRMHGKCFRSRVYLKQNGKTAGACGKSFRFMGAPRDGKGEM